MSRVLVTGATGFIGRALVRRLLEGGWSVRAAVRGTAVPSAGVPAGVPAGVELIPVGDLERAVDWGPALEGVEFVVHLAARVHRPGETGAEALACYRRANVGATRRLAAAAAAAGVRRLMLMSSVKALGEGGLEPLSAATVPAPVDPYGISKLEAEQALAAAAGSRLEWTVLRPPLVYGPGVGANFLRLMRAIRRGVPLPLGAVRNRRSLVHVGNLADATIRCLDHPAASGRCFLIHDGEAVPVPELVRRLARLLGRPARLVTVPLPLLRAAATLAGASAAFERLCGSLEVDDSELRCATGWLPPVTLEEGLRATTDHFAAHQ